ncbi:MAG: hypothetical protein PUA84_05000, partial [Oscillospiraceae bacterium]|nr:hypothetical protein [Oscillospiraceae bacterium]
TAATGLLLCCAGITLLAKFLKQELSMNVTTQILLCQQLKRQKLTVKVMNLSEIFLSLQI